MTQSRITGWRNYALAVICILVGLIALMRGDWTNGPNILLAGFALITLRNVMGKVLAAIEANQQSLDNLRGALETCFEVRKGNE